MWCSECDQELSHNVAVIRSYRKTPIKKTEEKIRFDIFSEDTSTYTASCYALATPSLAADLHRQHGYRVRFNDDPNYPQIVEIIEEVPIPNSISSRRPSSH